VKTRPPGSSRAVSGDGRWRGWFGRIFRRSEGMPPIQRERESRAVYVGDNRVLITTVHGRPLFVDSRDLSLAPQLILSGCWEPGITRAIMSLVKPGMTIIEIGANVGYYTTLFGNLVGPTGSVRAFEANPEVFDLLTQNLAINGLIPRVKAERMLVCDTCGEREITVLARHRGSGSMLSFTDEFVAMFHDTKTIVRMPATTLDEYWCNDDLPVDLIKIDAEGSEPMIFAGMQRILRRPHLRIVCEFVKPFFTGGGQSAEAFLESLLGHGFTLQQITDSGEIAAVAPRELLTSDTGTELLLTK
jgi:FkbM family methyltransferase